MGDLSFGALKALDNMVIAMAARGLIVAIAPCETIMVNGVCPAPCKGDDDPLCGDDRNPAGPDRPGRPHVVDRTPPSYYGGGGRPGALAACPKQSHGSWV